MALCYVPHEKDGNQNMKIFEQQKYHVFINVYALNNDKFYGLRGGEPSYFIEVVLNDST